MNEKQRAEMNAQIVSHGQFLVWHYGATMEPVALCKRLRRIENRLHSLAEADCNEGLPDGTWWQECEAAAQRICALLPKLPREHLHFNGDPRGFALKLRREHTPAGMWTDLGGYGVLAPDFSPW